MKKLLYLFPLAGMFLNPSAARADDSFASEASHFLGSAAFASVSTVVITKYFPKVKKPALKGFMIAASEAVIAEGVAQATGGKFSALDAVSGSFGAATGAYVTNKWYVAPRLSSRDGERTYAVMVVKRF